MGNVLVIFHFEDSIFFDQGRIGYEAVAGAMRYFGVPPLSRRFVEELHGLTAGEIAIRCLCTQNEEVLAAFEKKLLELALESSAARKTLKPACIQMLRIIHDAGAAICVYTAGSPESLDSALKKAGVQYVHVTPFMAGHMHTIDAIKKLLPVEKTILAADDREALEAGRRAGCVSLAPSEGRAEKSGVFNAPPDMEAFLAQLLHEME